MAFVFILLALPLRVQHHVGEQKEVAHLCFALRHLRQLSFTHVTPAGDGQVDLVGTTLSQLVTLSIKPLAYLGSLQPMNQLWYLGESFSMYDFRIRWFEHRVLLLLGYLPVEDIVCACCLLHPLSTPREP